MHTSKALYLTLLLSIASAIPTPAVLAPRAGGPAIVPIPETCRVATPLPIAKEGSTSYLPSPASGSDILYSAYYPSFSPNKTAMAQQCAQQCYGYGNHTECKTAYWAEKVVVPAGYYGTPGGQLSTACLFFTRPLSAADFTVAPAGQATGAFAGTIAC